MQVLMHEATWNDLIREHTDLLADDMLFSNMGQHKLKGITKKIYITQAGSNARCRLALHGQLSTRQ